MSLSKDQLRDSKNRPPIGFEVLIFQVSMKKIGWEKKKSLVQNYSSNVKPQNQTTEKYLAGLLTISLHSKLLNFI